MEYGSKRICEDIERHKPELFKKPIGTQEVQALYNKRVIEEKGVREQEDADINCKQ